MSKSIRQCRPDATGEDCYLDEYRHMLALLGSDTEVWKTLQHQFSVIHQRTQTLFTLGALAITVTGFSGHRIVAAGPLSGVPLVVGLAVVLAALITAVYGVSRLRWISTMRGGDSAETFAMIIEARDRKSLLFRRAMAILVAGLGCYVLAVANYLLQASLGLIPIY